MKGILLCVRDSHVVKDWLDMLDASMVYGSLFVKCETKRLKLSFKKKKKKN